MDGSPPVIETDIVAPAAPAAGGDAWDVALRDGLTVRIRPARPSDRQAVGDFVRTASLESIAFRFFGAASREFAAEWSGRTNDANRFALVATTGPEERIVAHGVYVRTGAATAEVAFLVADDWQGHGIATILLGHLAAAAEHDGISTFTAEVMSSNHRMVDVFRASGYPVRLHSEAGVLHLEFPTSLSDGARERFEQRERTAARAAVRSFLAPASVAVIGASRHAGTVGDALLRNLVESGYTGALYAVNPNAGERIRGIPAFRSLGEVPAPVELAIIAVPAAGVANAARECARYGVRALLVISAGFAEVGGEGRDRQNELVRICRESGMRLIGPNCLGAINTDPAVRLDATFAGARPLAGPVAFLSQSGGLGIAVIEACKRIGLGLSSFVSVGNKADISGNDLLEFWEQDPATEVVLLYLESFGNPRKFARVARRLGRVKPVVAVKSGRSPAGARATSSHTGALVGASDVTVDALFRQAGVIRTDTLGEMFDVATLLAAQPAPRGSRVAIVTNAGGPGILAADACQAHGLEVAPLDAAVRARLQPSLVPDASTANPIDLIATAPAEHYTLAIDAITRARAADAILAVFVPALSTEAAEVAAALAATAQRADGLPIAAVFMTGEDPPRELAALPRHVPAFGYPEDAARALGHAARYASWQARPPRVVPTPPGCRGDEAAAVIADALAAGEEWLGPAEVLALLDCYGLPVARGRVVESVAEAIRVAAELGGAAVVLKGVSPTLLHKSDVGAVRIGLRGPSAIGRAAREIRTAVEAAGHRLDGLLVQEMAPAGVELLLGVVNDEHFGPVVACGAGGVNAEVEKDVAVRITPLTDIDAREMLASLRLFPLLQGYRGAPPCDIAAIEDALLRLSALVEAHPEIVELDANPLVAGPHRAVIVDARVRIARATPQPPLPSLLAR